MTVYIVCENPWHHGYARKAKDEAEAERLIAQIEADAGEDGPPGGGCIGPHIIETCRGSHP